MTTKTMSTEISFSKKKQSTNFRERQTLSSRNAWKRFLALNGKIFYSCTSNKWKPLHKSRQIMEQLNDFFSKLFAYLREHPQYGLLVAILLVILYLIGLIFDWKWTLLPSGNSDFTQMWIDLFGRNSVRFVKGVLAVLLLLALVYLYYHYK